ncbi:MAG TPA: DUF1552 domain-containing protein [Polyangiaceae bacterium]|nr:DUF1552 domain-containing protein [Polyangiaceae bacterium]
MKMLSKPLNRRTLLRGVLATGTAIAIPLPLLDAMLNQNGTAYAQTGVALKPVYVTWFFGNGVLPTRWKPAKTGSGAAWELSEQLRPLAAFKSHLTVISGLAQKITVGSTHPAGSASATTGAPLKSNSASAKSIDQIVADIIGKDTPFKSLEIGVTPATPNGVPNSLHTVSHTGLNAPKYPEFDPQKIFTRLFGGATTPPTPAGDAQAAKRAAVRGSILDATLADGMALSQRLGAADKLRLEQHLEGVRALERRLQSPAGVATEGCAVRAKPSAGIDSKSEAPPAVNTAMVELATMALACEKTRVLTYIFSLPAAHIYFRHLGAGMDTDYHNKICHEEAGDESQQTRVNKGVLYTMQCLNELLTKFSATRHGAGSLLDASLIYVTSCTAWGKTHTQTEWPVLLLGKAGGKLAGDQHLNFNNENLSRVLLTVAKTMGSTQTELGADQGKVSAELPGVHT